MTISDIIIEIDKLVSPVEGRACDSIEEALLIKLNEITLKETLNYLRCLENSLEFPNPFQDEQWWKYLCRLMEKLLELRAALVCADEKESLLSVNQIQTLRTSLEIFVSLSILAHLSPGIGVDLERRSKLQNELWPHCSESQQYYCLNSALRCVMSLREVDTFRRLLVSMYTKDCLAAIFQLLLCYPVILNADLSNKTYIKRQLACILEETPQPILIKDLMLLHGSEGCPAKLARALRLMMIERLMIDNGVIATVKAILDVVDDRNSPKNWTTLTVTAKLIATPHQKQIQDYRDKVYPQILKLLSTSEAQYAQIATICVRIVHEKEPEVCRKYFIDAVCAPFLKPSTEEQLSIAIESLYNLIGIPLSQHWAVDPSLFKAIHVQIFRLYVFVESSASHFKSKLKSIVRAILLKDMDFLNFIFSSINLKFNFGESGGVYSELTEEEYSSNWEDAADILLKILEDDSDKIKLIEAVLPSMDGELERRAACAKLLSELCTTPAVLQWISDNPRTLVVFLMNLLESDNETDIICLGLMVLSVMLNNQPNVKRKDWHVFDSLAEPLKKFKSKSDNVELRVLADDLYATILTRGAVKVPDSRHTRKLPEMKKSNEGNYRQAIADVNDPLLPVRAHALRVLSKLVVSKDSDAEKNKETIFCIFKENLKSDDSYVYLSAVEGMASFAGTFPDEVLMSLTEQFVHCKVPETRLKTGEVLMRVIRILGEMAAVYKNEIINCLLHGCRDSDHFVRASSLSSLGELCRILTYRIHAFLIEIFECIKQIFETDKAMEPRRAAVMLLTSLLKGLGTDALTFLEPVLLSLYRLLKFIYKYEKDDITKLHAQLAIEELNSSTIIFLQPPQELKKHIFVLNPPK